MPESALPQVTAIARALGKSVRRFDIDVLERCESTNANLLARADAGAPSGTVIVAVEQTAGRGRRGRAWVSTPGDSLTFSLLWRFAPGTAPAGLSLAVGVAVAEALENCIQTRAAAVAPTAGPSGDTAPNSTIGLKWPNDILKQGRKLGGILVELVPGMPHAAVIGIGINLRLPPALSDDVRATAAAVDTKVDCNFLLAELLQALLRTLERFADGGFAALRMDWLARHAFQDSRVRLNSDFAPPQEGICRGVDSDGALLLEIDGRTERVLSGEVSLRPTQQQ